MKKCHGKRKYIRCSSLIFLTNRPPEAVGRASNSGFSRENGDLLLLLEFYRSII
ncbi:hypothetical protein HMPREF1870_00491 [Bacteroidales bacterium KA00344]|nr:hypothetical protein HMPREF1870_00491 [Bacteroidales bacterium KA00344]